VRRSGGIQVLVALALLALSLSPVVMQPTPSDSLGGPPAVGTESPGVESLIGDPLRADRYFSGKGYDDGSSAPSVDQDVRVVATLKDNAPVSDQLERKYGRVYTQKGTRRISATVSLSGIREFSSSPSVRTVYIENRPNVEDQLVADGVETTGADTLHDRGVTGDGMTVGVIGSGFRMSHPSVADQVRMYRMFSKPGPPVHGTAVASVVADTAPDAKLHLAAVGPETSPTEYREAVQYLVNSGTDVVVDSGSYFGQPGDGSGPISEIASGVPEDVTFVTSAGNYAQRHWAGTESLDDGSERVAFVEGQTKNFLAGGASISGRVSLGLQWDGDVDYDLYLYRQTAAGNWIWQSSETAGNAENISITVPKGQYYVTVERNGTAPKTPVNISLFSNRKLRHRTSSGSLTAPATAPGVVAVGTTQGTGAAPFSSRGPTDGGGLGVDLVAPDDARITGATLGNGTSFAAPYVAGTIALLREEYPELTAAEVVTAIEQSAVDVGIAGADPATGHGRLDAAAAATRAEELAIRKRQADERID
jgi:hypothetical protein